MKKHIIAAVCALSVLAAAAEDTIYLVKGDKVVAKYSTEEVDYATFKLPEGVKDPDEPLTGTMLGAVGSYFGTTDGVANFQLELTERAIWDEGLPNTFLYIQFMSNAADYHDLKFEEGTYTIGDGETLDPFKFHPGIIVTGPDQMTGVGGTFIVTRDMIDRESLVLVDGGSFTITKSDDGYEVAGTFDLENGESFEFSYVGNIIIQNVSDEQDPAEEFPLPESSMTTDVDLTFNYVLLSNYGQLFADQPDFNYYQYTCYTNDDYDEYLQVGIAVKNSEGSNVIIPAGTYELQPRSAENFAEHDALLIYPFTVQGTYLKINYGCWYNTGYDTVHNALTSGKLEILEDVTNPAKVNMKVTLYDNAETPHTVSATYSGEVDLM